MNDSYLFGMIVIIIFIILIGNMLILEECKFTNKTMEKIFSVIGIILSFSLFFFIFIWILSRPEVQNSRIDKNSNQTHQYESLEFCDTHTCRYND